MDGMCDVMLDVDWECYLLRMDDAILFVHSTVRSFDHVIIVVCRVYIASMTAI